jgi:hypothetical protein
VSPIWAHLKIRAPQCCPHDASVLDIFLFYGVIWCFLASFGVIFRTIHSRQKTVLWSDLPGFTRRYPDVPLPSSVPPCLSGLSDSCPLAGRASAVHSWLNRLRKICKKCKFRNFYVCHDRSQWCRPQEPQARGNDRAPQAITCGTRPLPRICPAQAHVRFNASRFNASTSFIPWPRTVRLNSKPAYLANMSKTNHSQNNNKLLLQQSKLFSMFYS